MVVVYGPLLISSGKSPSRLRYEVRVVSLGGTKPGPKRSEIGLTKGRDEGVVESPELMKWGNLGESDS